jgi:hypothetical protein
MDMLNMLKTKKKFQAEQKELADDEKLERDSELIWKDRSTRTDQLIRWENFKQGNVGNAAFDLDLQKANEARFMANLETRRQYVTAYTKQAKKNFILDQLHVSLKAPEDRISVKSSVKSRHSKSVHSRMANNS